MHRVLHKLGGVVDLEDTEVGAALNREQDAVGALNARLQQRRSDSELGGFDGPICSPGRTDTHQCASGSLHNRLDVGEVEVDQTGGRDQIGDALHTGEQHLVGGRERLEHADAPIADLQQAVVRYDDEGVDLVLEGGDTLLGLGGPTLAFKAERLGDNTDRQCSYRLGDAGHDGSAAGAGSAPLARGHENHVRTGEGLFDFFGMVFGCPAAYLRVGAGAETSREFPSDVELDVGVAHQERLGVCVDGDELDSTQAKFDHPVHGVDAATADAHNFDDCEVVLVGCHVRPPLEL